jgi:hypothetical protein
MLLNFFKKKHHSKVPIERKLKDFKRCMQQEYKKQEIQKE